ncbi:MAG: glycosyltransferase family 2 protein [Candidatus Brocadiae bacterium]|nr:glycosyltransferase family 2 protein [Candidatus Brocadiia bacterium]
MPDLSVIVPVYNESAAIGAVLDELHGVLDAAPEVEAFEILVVDDGSTDGTADAVRSAAERAPSVRLVARERNRGYGAAIKHGLQHAAHGLVAIIDGDGTYPPDAIPKLLAEMGDAAMVVGARQPGQGVPAIRRPAKWVLRTLASYLAEEPIPDLNSGLRIFRKDACLRYFRLLPSRFSFTTTITLAMLCDELDVCYVPIAYRQRQGRSKIRPIRDTLGFLMLIAQTVTYFRPLKVLGPLALAVFLAGAIKGTCDLLIHDPTTGGPNLKTSDLLLLVAGIQLFALGLLADLVCKRR